MPTRVFQARLLPQGVGRPLIMRIFLCLGLRRKPRLFMDIFHYNQDSMFSINQPKLFNLGQGQLAQAFKVQPRLVSLGFQSLTKVSQNGFINLGQRQLACVFLNTAMVNQPKLLKQGLASPCFQEYPFQKLMLILPLVVEYPYYGEYFF